MAAETITPNMNLIVPAVGVTEGPLYATDINQTLTLIDQHNHSPGFGVPINPAGMSINADLTFQSNNATTLRSARFAPNASPLSLGTDLGCLYEAGVDLWYNDGNGNQIRITQSGGIVGTPGSISGLTPPASVTYVSATPAFVFQSNASIAANLDAGAVTFRNVSPNSTFGVTVQPVPSLSSNYTLVLPTLPASQKIMTLDNSGNIAAPYSVDGTTIHIVSNVISVNTPGLMGITGSQLSPTANIEGSQLDPSAGILGTQIAQNTITGAVSVNGTTGNLALGTVSINNMGTPNYVASADSVTFSTSSASYTNVTNLANAITTHGRMVKMFFTFPAVPLGGAVGINTDGSAAMRILRDGSATVVDFQFSGFTVPQLFYDVPSAGSHSYTVQTKLNSGSFVSWTSVVFVCVED